ncbi:MAG: glycosyltransferase family 2 protein [Fimbriimonadaceae bacterium]
MLSILIVNWNTRNLLDACLASIARHSSDVEVIVVDNASSDGSADMVAEKYPLVKLVSSPKNLGYAEGNNLAFSHSTGEFVLLLNPDTEVYEDTLPLAVSTLEGMSGYGALGAKQIFTDGTTQASVRGFPSFWGLVGDFTKLGRLIPAMDSYRMGRFDYDKAQDAPQPMGTFLLLRRSAIEGLWHPSGVRDDAGLSPGSRGATPGYSDANHVGVFAENTAAPPLMDENFPIFFNEVDLLYRLHQSGWKCWYEPKVRVLHHGAEGTKQVRKSMIWESHRSLLRFLGKHRLVPFLPLLKPLIFFAAFVRARGVHEGFKL